MKKIIVSLPDMEECISAFNRLAGNLRDDAEFARTACLAGDIPDEAGNRIMKLFTAEAEAAEEAATLLSAMTDNIESAEEKISVLVKKTVFEHKGSIVVEKSKENVPSVLLCGKGVKHSDSLKALVIRKSHTGESE
ncbi:MAG: hypothetical protein J6U36_05145 [Oscillospiraceae bacterium]|nr:hypothetical protein [Oscillospiraceae bacterium]